MCGVEVISETNSHYMPSDLKPEATAPAEGLKNFRRLKRGEVVTHGDWVADEQRGFEPWVGPGGFHADAFVNPIYRKKYQRSAGAKKSS
jgi:hypothetical protein